MFQRMLTGGLIAGFAAGLLAAFLHFAFVQKLILLGEEYETGAKTHFAGLAPAEAHDHGEAVEAGHDHGADAAHDHADEGEEASALQRNGLTVLFFGLTYAAYGLVLSAGFGLASHLGQRIGPVQGLLWGLAGFASFQLLPAMGLAPELPGTPGAELGARQVWWWGTVAGSAFGLGLLGWGLTRTARPNWAAALAGLALLALPHVIGAPEVESFAGIAPPELAALFAARVLGCALVVWAFLGGLSGLLWARQNR